MTKPIHLDRVVAADAPQRLNLFAGRHLGEREFDLLQAYADDRLAPLLAPLRPGIVAGLEASFERDASDEGLHLFQISPGTAIGGDGRPLRLHFRLEETWPQLLEHAERERGEALVDGLYFLHLDRSVELADADLETLPCCRTEPDPLRDRRLETVTLLGLRLITCAPTLLALPARRAANRLCARFLDESPFDTVNGGVPLALLLVKNRAPKWFDGLAGRYGVSADATSRAFLAHTRAALDDYRHELAKAGGKTAPGKSLAKQIGLDFLPAAGPLPAELLHIEPLCDPSSDGPRLGFAPEDLQIDLIPVPAATVTAVIEHELPRGMVDLVSGRGDRLRLLLAIDDPDYRPNLLDLPQPDLELETDLDQRGIAAVLAWQAWKAAWLELFGRLDGLPAERTRGVKVPPLPANEADFLAGLSGCATIGRIVAQRGEKPPHPYSDWKSTPRLQPRVETVATAQHDGLHKQRLDLEAEIDALEGELEENFALINLLNDFLGLQRQHLDAIAVSFSSLAGGVPGDGSGMNLMRWAKYADFEPQQKKS